MKKHHAVPRRSRCSEVAPKYCPSLRQVGTSYIESVLPNSPGPAPSLEVLWRFELL